MAKTADADDDDKDEVGAVGRGALVSTVLSESRTEHLISGFIGSVRGDVLARLARELAALGLSADVSYQTLTNKRAIVMHRIYTAYEADYRKQKGALSRRRRFENSGLHVLQEIGISAGVNVMLSMLMNAATKDPPLCLQILNFLKM